MMTEIFEALADAVSEPESFNVLVTALEAQSENVPRWAVVTKRLLHEQIKMSEKTQPWRGRTKSPVHNTEEWTETPIHLPFLSQDRTF